MRLGQFSVGGSDEVQLGGELDKESIDHHKISHSGHAYNKQVTDLSFTTHAGNTCLMLPPTLKALM